MSSESPTSQFKETVLDVANGRTVAFANNGDLSSSLAVVFFPGTLSVGKATEVSRYLASKGAHFISPTIPGYGNTSPPAKGVTYAATITSDTTAILNHLYPNSEELQLYICGGSFGTVPAQILYGASFERFPHGRYMKGLLLVGTFPPLATKHKFNWAKHMTWPNYISAGPPATIVPFRLIQRLMSLAIAPKLKTQEGAEAFLKDFMFDKMKDEEKEMYRAWREERGYDENKVLRELAEMNRRSVANSWEGLMSSAEVIRSDWWEGKKLEELDDAHTKGRSVLVVGGKDDDATPPAWAEFTASVYPNARLKWLKGGHICAMFQMDDIYKDFLEGPSDSSN